MEMALAQRTIFYLLAWSLVTGCTGQVGEQCAASVAGSCPAGWVAWGKACYKVTADRFPAQADALNACSNAGAVMAAPTSEQEDLFLHALVGQTFWINCSDIREEGNFECAGDNAETTFRNWRDGEPSNSNSAENCVSSSATGWNDITCNLPGNGMKTVCKAPMPKLHF